MGVGSIGVVGAFLGGLLSLLSPCSALLLPSFFAYAFDGVGKLVQRTAVFYLGMIAVLVPMGAGVGAVGSLLTVHRSTVTMVAGVVVIALGVFTGLGGGFRFGGRFGPDAEATARGTGVLNVAVLGAVYGLAGFCSGPLLGAILTVALAGGSPVQGGALMAVYALGMAAPLLLMALLWEKLDLGSRSWLRPRSVKVGPVHTNSLSLIAGVVLVGLGVLFIVTGGTAGLGGVTTVDQQFAMQEWLTTVSGAVSDLWVVLGVLVLVAVGLVVYLVRGARRASDDATE
ncbi:cytochrome c biogenesis CcdA family protein [Corynebacterium freneyi]|uniref:Cytochrome c biogenesis protein CcdA n=1 Tax=Corynebacterium freneyi TaxID=134034 RepID=A0ABS4U4X9_9CORY|nr:cytochrome c biogenesis protein CcdA [Corynebacterium freneyi]MBP2331709.1 cytochrome c biogenesis protein CcdA [Corynebacterium freneyi]MCG7439223.1 sulfite exporter TauE/SafE family protein [Corynebacterium freneyi]QXA51845.1 sulfite exporter TauE/SafE family protein [Corynebacterium freneyi]UBI02040.1 sulfite exporter TauE/SafE family protein [Corynebacterium freneyi]WJZ06168.1 Cytochrome C biogenesis protein transmembrane region [Corynebacterium freneyi]